MIWALPSLRSGRALCTSAVAPFLRSFHSLRNAYGGAPCPNAKQPCKNRIIRSSHRAELFYITLPRYTLENEADSISFFSSVLGVNRIRLLVMLDESTSSAFANPFDENESFTRPKFPSWILNPFFRYIGSFRTSDVSTASTSVTFKVQASEMSFAKSITVSSSIYCGAA